VPTILTPDEDDLATDAVSERCTLASLEVAVQPV